MPSGTLFGHKMCNSNLRHIKKVPLRPVLTCANTELCLFAADRESTNTTNLTTEASHSLKNLSAYTHAGSDRIAYWRTQTWHTPITTPNNPIKLRGKPRRFLTFPI